MVRTFDLRNLVADLGSNPAIASIVAIPLPSLSKTYPAKRPTHSVSLASQDVALPGRATSNKQQATSNKQQAM
ncbi:MAG: hypothetical protein MUP13_05750, partial [Thermoanaerobaculales bacterium]|nr:hypothetical protein [Thermoanaerobaculales bacterium]